MINSAWTDKRQLRGWDLGWDEEAPVNYIDQRTKAPGQEGKSLPVL